MKWFFLQKWTNKARSDMEHERRTHSVQKGGEAFVALATALDPKALQALHLLAAPSSSPKLKSDHA